MLNWPRILSAPVRHGWIKAATGRAGEDAAAQLARSLGWNVLERNWREGPLELDLICQDGDTVVFVEVKTRSQDSPVPPSAAFTPVKRRSMVQAARAWLAAHDAWDRPCRFDLVEVRMAEGHCSTELTRHVIELGSTGNPVGSSHTTWQPW